MPFTQTPTIDFAQFSAAVSRSFVPLAVSTRHPERFAGRITSASGSDFQLTEVTATEHVVERTPELIVSAQRDHYKIGLMLAGNGLLIQDGREALLSPGTLAIYDTSRPYTLEFGGPFRTMVVMVDKCSLQLPETAVGQLTAVGMGSGAGAAGLVVPFLGQLAANLSRLSPVAASRLSRNAVDLITTMLADEVMTRSVPIDARTAMLQRIMEFIDGNLSSPELVPRAIAAAHFISVRHLHNLFHDNGTTVSRWIKDRRLERCRHDLLDVAQAGLSVATIAGRWGFFDATHFSRDFKEKFGAPPSECRPTRRVTSAGLASSRQS